MNQRVYDKKAEREARNKRRLNSALFMLNDAGIKASLAECQAYAAYDKQAPDYYTFESAYIF